ncbi:hypothetical protein PR202_ga17564 [Eleusine coracana subsp. coracana]|uniref:Protein kinase domain-containing protein n=1 Tax=Eleusine coracana subsp. coracana TaxID=191504 RepID=A0AAV5CRB1_ELECO|nr:hypothetical protein PR202_ga17317 [Eleusine coracana subsp. coracana]GJN00385.1 hypothetical protein PR202_ga17564 [Eleusine coracana subsp. coracana]
MSLQMDAEGTMLNHLERMIDDENAEPIDLKLSLLEAITSNFSEDLKIGSGGFAAVYKGLLGNGKTVAVKKLYNTLDMKEKKYNEEVGCLMRVKNKNIVRFLGYCADTQGKMCDFGGKFVMADVRHRGYLAPESYDGVITLKSDIYSLGVIVQEILTGQKRISEMEEVSTLCMVLYDKGFTLR